MRAALDSLGEAAYASLREAGAVMPLDEVIALASQQLDTDPGFGLRIMPWSAEVPPAAPIGPLTGREAQVAALVASGLSNREIAERVTVSKRTVDAHVDHIFTKLRISSRIQLTNWLRDRISPPRPGPGQAPARDRAAPPERVRPQVRGCRACPARARSPRTAP